MRFIIDDVRQAIQGLRSRPIFTTSCTLIVAAGITACGTVLSFIDAVLMRPLPIPEPHRVVRIEERAANPLPGRDPRRNLRLSDIAYVAGNAKTLESVSGGLFTGSIPLSGFGPTVRVPVTRVATNFFRVIKVQPSYGRAFTNSDHQPPAPDVAILSHAAALRLFGSVENALDSHLTLNGRQHDVIGVMPAGFSFPERPDIYLPLKPSPFTDRFHVTSGIARLRSGVDAGTAQAEIGSLIAALAASDPGGDHGSDAAVTGWHARIVETVRPGLLMLAGAGILVLILVSINLGGLLINRTMSRGQELAIRRSLGAPELRLAWLIMSEGLIIGAAGGALGLIFTFVTLDAIVRLSPADLPFRDAVQFNPSVAVASFALAAITGLFAGLLPALRTNRLDLLSVRGAQSHIAGPRPARSAHALAIAQVALATLLVSGASVLTLSFWRTLSVDPGLKTTRILTIAVTLSGPGDARALTFFREALDEIRTLPGVRDATVSLFSPMRGGIGVDVQPTPARSTETVTAYLYPVAPGYFELLNIPVVDGRQFLHTDDERAPLVAIIDRMAAERFWPGEPAIGKSVRVSDKTYQIVGVTENVRQRGLLEEIRPGVYLPFEQYSFGAGTFVLETAADPLDLANPVRELIHRMDPLRALDYVETLDDVIDRSVAQPRFYSVIVGSFGALSGALAIAGLYAVMVFSVRRRLFEFGIRSAIGARPADNLWLVLRQSLSVSLSGIAIGTLLSMWLAEALRGLLFQTEPADPLAIGIAAGSLLLACVWAGLTPALQAARQDPAQVLRA